MDDTYAFMGIAGPDGQFLCAGPDAQMDLDLSNWAPDAGSSRTGDVIFGRNEIDPATGDAVMPVLRTVGSYREEGVTLAIVAVRLNALADSLGGGMRDGPVRLVVTDVAGHVVATTLETVPIGSRLDMPAPDMAGEADIQGTVLDIFVDEVAIENETFHVAAMMPGGGTMAESLTVLSVPVLAILLLGLAMAFIGSQRADRGLSTAVRYMRDRIPLTQMGRATAVETRNAPFEAGSGARDGPRPVAARIDAGLATHEGGAGQKVAALLRLILDRISDGVILQDRDGTILYMNSGAQTILGVTRHDPVGGDMGHALSGAVRSHLAPAVRDALDTGERQTFDCEIAGSQSCVRVAVDPSPDGVAIHLQDVTKEHADRARSHLLGTALARVSDVVLITEGARPETVVYVNEAFTAMTGYAKDEVLGATPRILQGPDTEQERLDEIREAIQACRCVRTELTNYRKDGSRFTTELDITPLFDASGACTHFVSVQRDMTERRNRESLLRAREEQFRLASMASQDIIWDWDVRDGVIWNSDHTGSTFWPVAKWHVENIEGGRIENALDRVHPDDRRALGESLDAALQGDAQTWRCEYRMKAQDGSWRNMIDKVFILRDDDGAPRRMVGAMSDVTDLRLLDAQLHQSQKLEAVGKLTGGIAHDFNSLLTVILGNCDILLDDLGENAALRSIEAAAEWGARISNDLLAFSRRQPLESRPTDINKLIRDSATLFERAVETGVTIDYDLTDAPAVAHADPDRLQAALLNLVINANAAIPQAGTITIRTRPKHIEDDGRRSDCAPGDYIRIDVIDDGIGMSPEVVARAFEPFFTTKAPGVGTGMGLSSVYGMAKQSGGHARIDSEVGSGTDIVLCLPVSLVSGGDTPQPRSSAARERGTGHRILVVEPDGDLRSFVCAALNRRGFCPVIAETGEHALDLLENDSGFDLVFTDIVLPGRITGAQLVRRAQQMHPGIGVLFTSGHTRDAPQRHRDLPQGVTMLDKPFRTNELIAKVKQGLATRPAPPS
ncbi:PAS domain S-box protein [Roseovarius tibetensis]|uniref:hybrid sensor histidine kinase/response regulator n=1 Tax=Roseovarius tibetensis TaxID=2685897 RepID=UPI003D7F5415